MSALFIGKRFYTNRDALREQYGRIYQLPWHWANAGIPTMLWLVDYHTCETLRERDGFLDILSTPVRNFALFHSWRCMRACRDVEVVIGSGDCYIGLMAYWIARRLGARFVFDVYDKYDEFGGYVRLPGIDLFGFLLRRADAKLFASRALMEQVGGDKRIDLLVPNGIDTRRFRSLDKCTSRSALGLPENSILIGYFGGMEIDRGVDDLIAAVCSLRVAGRNIELVLGGKPSPGMDLAVPGVHFLGNIPYATMPVALSSCDLLAVPYRRSAFMDAGASNKIAESIACRRPIVATRTPNFLANFPEQASALKDLLAEPGNPEDLARVIDAQCERRIEVRAPDGFDWCDIAEALITQLGLFVNPKMLKANT